jgi:hypothetical protein
MPARKLPAAADEPCDAVAGREFGGLDHRGTAVVSAWISICVEIFVASLFARASALVVKERLERAALSLINVRLPKLEQLDEGAVRAAFVWNIVAHSTVCFIIFVSVLTCLGAVRFPWNSFSRWTMTCFSHLSFLPRLSFVSAQRCAKCLRLSTRQLWRK